METLKNERAKALRTLTRVKNEISALITVEETKVETIGERLALYEKHFVDFTKAHEEYISKLDDEKVTWENNAYYQPKFEDYQQFSKKLSEWIIGKEEVVKPEDSISQVSSKGSKNSRASSVNTVASTARMEEEAKLAELKARAELTRKRREIAEKERQLQQEKEDYELEIEMKLAETKANVYKKYEHQELHVSDEENPELMSNNHSKWCVRFDSSSK